MGWTGTIGRRAARGAAFLAVVLLTLAGVRSQVMQAAAASPMAAAACDMAMPGMRHDAPAPGQAKSVCQFCFAAAHAPLQADVARPLPPVSVATIPPYATRPALGPRGPPALPSRARGPPTPLLTA